MKNRAKIIIETDDDNCPKKKFFDKKKLQHSASEIKNTSWINIYNLFSKNENFIWPRGLPLNQLNSNKINLEKAKLKNFHLQQGLCEKNPDVDAIYRIFNKNININFKNNYKISLGNSISTFNSQNTIWLSQYFRCYIYQ